LGGGGMKDQGEPDETTISGRASERDLSFSFLRTGHIDDARFPTRGSFRSFFPYSNFEQCF
jgi:hypothetical protein